MKDQKAKTIVASLIHDIGKVIYRQGGDRRNHSISGYDYLKEETTLDDKEVLDCVRYHHAYLLKNACIDEKSLAYVVYIADNIAAFADRREKEKTEEKGFELSTPLQSVFNILNGNHQEYYYPPMTMKEEYGVPYPSEEKRAFSQSFYEEVKAGITDALKGINWNAEYVNSLISTMEAYLSYVPSSTAKSELADISLFDHVKFTAAVASCIYDYLEERKWSYRRELFTREKDFYEKDRIGG